VCVHVDDDKYGHDFLGEAKFPLNKLKPRITRDLCLNLEKHIPVHIYLFLSFLMYLIVASINADENL